MWARAAPSGCQEVLQVRARDGTGFDSRRCVSTKPSTSPTAHALWGTRRALAFQVEETAARIGDSHLSVHQSPSRDGCVRDEEAF